MITLAARHPRYGAGTIYLKLRQQGHMVNRKRVDRLYTEAHLQLRCRTRKKVPVGARQQVRVSRGYGLTRRTQAARIGRWF